MAAPKKNKRARKTKDANKRREEAKGNADEAVDRTDAAATETRKTKTKTETTGEAKVQTTQHEEEEPTMPAEVAAEEAEISGAGNPDADPTREEGANAPPP